MVKDLNIRLKRPSSLHSAKEEPWTEGDLRTFIYRPPVQLIPPRVLVAYYSVDNDQILRSRINKLVKTLEVTICHHVQLHYEQL